MSNWRLATCAAAALVLAASVAEAAPSPAQLVRSQRLADAQRLSEVAAATEPAYVDGLMAAARPELRADPDIARMARDTMLTVTHDLNRKVVQERVVLLAEVMSPEELEAAIAFAESPIGRSISEKQLASAAEMTRRQYAAYADFNAEYVRQMKAKIDDCSRRGLKDLKVCAVSEGSPAPPH